MPLDNRVVVTLPLEVVYCTVWLVVVAPLLGMSTQAV